MGNESPFLVIGYHDGAVQSWTVVYPADPATSMHKEVRYSFTDKGIVEQVGIYPKVPDAYGGNNSFSYSEDKGNALTTRTLTLEEFKEATKDVALVFGDWINHTGNREYAFIGEAPDFTRLEEKYKAPEKPKEDKTPEPEKFVEHPTVAYEILSSKPPAYRIQYISFRDENTQLSYEIAGDQSFKGSSVKQCLEKIIEDFPNTHNMSDPLAQKMMDKLHLAVQDNDIDKAREEQERQQEQKHAAKPKGRSR